MIPSVLTIAGSDSGGGAGIQADLKTFQMRGVYGTCAITAVTAQNTLGIRAVHMIPPEHIAAQIQAVGADFDIAACKIGMLGTEETIECVADCLQQQSFGALVLDPVMTAKGGTPLLRESALRALKRELLPRTHILTPNLPETEILTGIAVRDDASAQRAAQILCGWGVKNVVIKGGHADASGSPQCRDWLWADGKLSTFVRPRFHTRHTHGTGCTFSACLVAELAKGNGVADAVAAAKHAITAAISQAACTGHGHGAVNHWALADFSGCLKG